MESKKNSRSFPWYLYRRYLLGQLVFVLPLLFSAAYLTKIVYFDEITFLDDKEQFWVGVALFIIFLFLITNLLIVWSLLAPLGRAIELARAIGEGRQTEFVDFVGAEEWSELLGALKKIDQKAGLSSENSLDQVRSLRELFENLSDGVLVLDQRMNLIFANSQLRELAQVEDFSSVQNLHDVFRDPEIFDVFQTVLERGIVEKIDISFDPNKEDTRQYYTITVAPLQSRGGVIVGAVGVFHDISELKQAELMRIEFVASVSHELRTPLTSLKGYTQALLEDVKSGNSQDIEHYSNIISKGINKLMSLVGDLLDLSALEAGVSLDIQELDTRDITETTLTHLETLRNQKNHEIHVSYLQEKVWADKMRLEQVLTNLLQNAIKYIPEKSHIGIEWSKLGSSYIQLRVYDNGPGISSEHLPRLFERFYRADKARSPDKGGTGLGLAIVKHIVQRHNGTVKVHSRVGVGTEFICRFPIPMM